MIQANELRVGNFYDQFGNIHQANGSIIAELEKAPESQLWCKPIPLTEEWLLKFEGVNESSDDDEFHAFDFEYKGIELCKDWESGKFYHINDSALVWLDYVHTFQNLIFALTGEELKQKEVSNG